MKKIILAALLLTTVTTANAGLKLYPYYAKVDQVFVNASTGDLDVAGVYLEVEVDTDKIVENYGIAVVPKKITKVFGQCSVWYDTGQFFHTGLEEVPLLAEYTRAELQFQIYPHDRYSFYVNCPWEDIANIQFVTSEGSIQINLYK